MPPPPATVRDQPERAAPLARQLRPQPLPVVPRPAGPRRKPRSVAAGVPSAALPGTSAAGAWDRARTMPASSAPRSSSAPEPRRPRAPPPAGGPAPAEPPEPQGAYTSCRTPTHRLDGKRNLVTGDTTSDGAPPRLGMLPANPSGRPRESVDGASIRASPRRDAQTGCRRLDLHPGIARTTRRRSGRALSGARTPRPPDRPRSRKSRTGCGRSDAGLSGSWTVCRRTAAHHGAARKT